MNNQRGLTLVELLAAIIISSFVLLFSTTLLINSFKTQEKVTTEIAIRDAADFILSSLIKEIYTSKNSEFKFIEDPSHNNYYLEKIDDSSTITGFKNEQIYLNGSTLQYNDAIVEVVWEKSEIGYTEDTNLNRTYTIMLTLQSTKNNFEKTFKTEVRSINDLKKEEEEG